MLLPTARECADTTSNGGTYLAYLALCLSQIATALQTAGTYTCTLTVAGKQGADVMAVRRQLIARGFAVTQSSNTLTISWAS